MKTYDISEIFLSIQGEGLHVGRMCVFVRFAGCNLKCVFCDTDHRVKQKLTAEEIGHAVTALVPWKHTVPIVLTGGEPLLQLDVELVDALDDLGPLHIETNGLGPQEALQQLGRFLSVVVSPKSVVTSVPVLRAATVLKVLWPLPDGLEWEDIEGMAREAKRAKLVLQPVTPPAEYRDDRTLAVFQVYCRGAWEVVQREAAEGRQWSLIPQTHVFMGLR